MKKPVRVFVASTPAEWLPMKILEFSIRETTSMPVELSGIYAFNRNIPMPRDVKNRPRTPFSFQRFLIPELCDYTGKAIYLDADMQVFSDIRNLWAQDFNKCDLQTAQEGKGGRRGQFSVMLLDCAALKWDVDQIVKDLDSGKLSYADLMYDMRVAKTIGRDILPEWNSLEYYEKGKTCLLHYTNMKTQPWVSISSPLAHVWLTCLQRALDVGFVSRDELKREIDMGHIRPSLLVQVNKPLDNSRVFLRSLKAIDSDFVPPYRSLQCGKGNPWVSIRSAVKSVLWRIYYRSGI